MATHDGHSYRIEFNSGEVFDITACSPKPASWSAVVYRRTSGPTAPQPMGRIAMVLPASSEAAAIHGACRLLTTTCGPIGCKSVKSVHPSGTAPSERDCDRLHA